MFNYALEKRTFPNRWAIGVIHPVHKKGDKVVPDNYRKITVLPAIGKVLEFLLNNRIKFKSHITNDNDPFQTGFRTKCRTTDNIFILNAIIEKQRAFKKPLYTCFIDFTKAFDYINRDALCQKLLKRGIDGPILGTIKSM